jgi:hypothetical protein
MSRFDYIKYDQQSVAIQDLLKQQVQILEKCVDDNIKDPRSKALVMTKLEEAYMWMGKGIRNDQIIRCPVVQLQEDRRSNKLHHGESDALVK